MLFFINQREDLNLVWGEKTEDWFVGACKNNNIYIFDPKVYDKESSHRKEEFWQTLKHEYCHIYYTQITKSHYPFWLNEGLACYLSGKKLVLKDGFKNKLFNIFSYYNKTDSNVYMIGQFWVEYLLKNFGKKKLLELINSIKPEMRNHQFAKEFYKIYGLKFNKDTFSKFIV